MQFNNDAMRRIARTVQSKENGVNPGNPIAQPPRLYPGIYEVKVTTQITAMNGATPGKGRGKLQKFDGTSFSEGSDIYDIYNKTEKKIAVGTYLTVLSVCGYLFAIVPDKCANLS